jgi:hypothetical protein
MQNSRASMHRVVDVLNILGSRHRVVVYLSDQRRNGDRLHVLQGRLLGQVEPRALVNGLVELLVAAGEVYYTAAWPRVDPDLRGKRIGVIGTGPSGEVSEPGNVRPVHRRQTPRRAQQKPATVAVARRRIDRPPPGRAWSKRAPTTSVSNR